MNYAIKTMCEHRTYRHFDPDFVLPPKDLELILQSARQAPSWMNGQHVSIINVRDMNLRREIVKKQPGSPQIGTCSVFLFFVGDLYRASLCAGSLGSEFLSIGNADSLITMVTDASLVAQNALVAAESLGYGTCMVGGLRLLCAELIEWFKLPRYTFPLFGLCIGKLEVEMKVKPRLPRQACVFDDFYQTEGMEEQLAAYEKTMVEFAEARETLPYREKFARFYAKDFAASNNELLVRQGLLTRMNR